MCWQNQANENNSMDFIWDKEKSETNLRKHHVSFDLAIRVFLDGDHVEIYDQKHSVDEDRYNNWICVECIAICRLHCCWRRNVQNYICA